MVGDWVVRWNEFYAIDPATASSISGFRNDGGYTVWDCYFSGDLAQVENCRAGRMIDLGWEPQKDPNGMYVARLLKEVVGEPGIYDWDHPLEAIETRIPSEVVEFIRRSMSQ